MKYKLQIWFLYGWDDFEKNENDKTIEYDCQTDAETELDDFLRNIPKHMGYKKEDFRIVEEK